MQEVVPVPRCTLQRKSQRPSCSPANRAMTTGEQWVSAFISTPGKHHSFHKLGRPSLAQASLFAKDVARHPLLGISRAIRDVTALVYVWLFSSQGYSIIGEGSCECISAYFSAKLARWADATSCGWVGRDTWCMAAYLTAPAISNMNVWLDL